MIGFSSLLLTDNLTQEQKEDIERIRNGGEALLSIISNILEISKAEKEKVKLELQPISLKRCIDESLDLVALNASEKGLNPAYIVSYGTPDTIIGDPGRLRQILANLLSNAVKFTDNGDISVSVSSKLIEGKKLVELMGGEIRAESVEGKGSTFKFTIPVETLPNEHLDIDEKDRAIAYENLSYQRPLSVLVDGTIHQTRRLLSKCSKEWATGPMLLQMASRSCSPSKTGLTI